MGEFRLSTTPTPHAEGSMAVRLGTGDGCVGFTGDTGPDQALGPFFSGCQLLLAECSHPEDKKIESHLTPEGLAALAQIAAPELLVTLHCYPALDPEKVPSLLAEAGYEGRVLTGWDGLSLDLTDGHVRELA